MPERAASESDVSRGPRWRARFVVGAGLLVWAVLAGRLVQLQWAERHRFADQVASQQSLTEVVPARPGDVVDRHGRLLATTVTARSLFAVPRRIREPWKFAVAVAGALDANPDRLFERLARNRDKHFVWIERRLDDEQAERIHELDVPAGTWGFREEYLRRYPQGQLACHVIGLRDVDGKGRGGIEQKLDGVIRGRDGRRRLVRDARGHVIAVRDEITEPPEDGRTVVLTLDAVVQLYAERALQDVAETWQPRSAAAIVLDAPTGEVLAIASWPWFDLENPADVPEDAWKNTAVASVFEPGSTFKPFVVAWGLEQGMIRRDEPFDCEHGEYRMGGRLLHDHHPYGTLSLTDVLVKSSNIGMAKIGERMGNAALHEAAVTFGFGRRTGLGLPGEVNGILRPLDEWNGYSTGSIPMGQEIAATPIQLATAHAALARGGKLLNPRLVLDVVETIPDSPAAFGQSRPGAAVVSETVSEGVARWVVTEPMTQVVERGTGTRAQLEEYVVFGKTGTAQKVDPETGTYSQTKTVCSFVCGAPADEPRVVVLVSVDEPTEGSPHYGGTVAAPAARDILAQTLRYLRVPTERDRLAGSGAGERR